MQPPDRFPKHKILDIGATSEGHGRFMPEFTEEFQATVNSVDDTWMSFISVGLESFQNYRRKILILKITRQCEWFFLPWTTSPG
jgi:hypothetical protein